MEEVETTNMKYSDLIREDLQHRARQRIYDALKSSAEDMKQEDWSPQEIEGHIYALSNNIYKYLHDVRFVIYYIEANEPPESKKSQCPHDDPSCQPNEK